MATAAHERVARGGSIARRERRARPFDDPIARLDPSFVEFTGVAVAHGFRYGSYLTEVGTTIRDVSRRPRQRVLEVVFKEENPSSRRLTDREATSTVTASPV